MTHAGYVVRKHLTPLRKINPYGIECRARQAVLRAALSLVERQGVTFTGEEIDRAIILTVELITPPRSALWAWRDGGHKTAADGFGMPFKEH